MTSIDLSAAGHRYRVACGSGLLAQSGELVREVLAAQRCAVITDTNTGPLFGERVSQNLTSVGFQPLVITVPAGEKSKSLEQVGEICDQMIAGGMDRQSFVVGLGGGVVGDISGFVAAIFHRGISHVQIPTTLLAMVDSSIGGKTGVNTIAGKNLIGALHQPTLVIDDVDVLQTLPERELSQGFAEVIKHAVIADAEMFQQVIHVAVAELDRFNRSSLETVVALIARNIEIKARVVAKDEHDETGERALLNFGHTVGHAIEAATNFEQLLHGEAISLGMIAAANISMKRAGLRDDERDAIVNLLRLFDLPTQLPANVSRKKILEAIPRDKKFEEGKIRFVLTPKIGSALLSNDVTMEDIQEAVDSL